MKRLLLTISILTGFLLVPVMFSGAASATWYSWNSRFPHTPGSTTTLNYTYQSPQRYNGNVWQGAKNWRDAAARVKPTPGSSSIKITVTDTYTSANWYGSTWFA